MAEAERDAGDFCGQVARPPGLSQRGHRGGFPAGSPRPPRRVTPRLTGEPDGKKTVSLRTHTDHAFQCHGKTPGLATRADFSRDAGHAPAPRRRHPQQKPGTRQLPFRPVASGARSPR